MILYHGTTYKRAQQIFEYRALKKNCERFLQKKKTGMDIQRMDMCILQMK